MSPSSQQNTSDPVGLEHSEVAGQKEVDNVSIISDGNQSIKSILSGTKQSRNYTMKEEIAILDFIATNRRFSEVNGNTLWQLMETKKSCRKQIMAINEGTIS